jgi:hypothetical protein
LLDGLDILVLHFIEVGEKCWEGFGEVGAVDTVVYSDQDVGGCGKPVIAVWSVVRAKSMGEEFSDTAKGVEVGGSGIIVWEVPFSEGEVGMDGVDSFNGFHDSGDKQSWG